MSAISIVITPGPSHVQLVLTSTQPPEDDLLTQAGSTLTTESGAPIALEA